MKNLKEATTMGKKLNLAGSEVIIVACPKKEPEMVEISDPWFKPNKGRSSVVPVKRRSVKRMIFDSIVNSISSIFFPRRLFSDETESAVPAIAF